MIALVLSTLLAVQYAAPTTNIGPTEISAARRLVTAIKGQDEFNSDDFVNFPGQQGFAPVMPLAACDNRPPRAAYDPDTVMIEWDCSEVAGQPSMMIMLHFVGGKIGTIELNEFEGNRT